jgi:N-acetylmuramoyl-L-alanine amidase
MISDACRVGSVGLQPIVQGMRLPVLRETRMPAVLFTVGPVQEALDQAGELVQSILDALESWAAGSPLSTG